MPTNAVSVTGARRVTIEGVLGPATAASIEEERALFQRRLGFFLTNILVLTAVTLAVVLVVFQTRPDFAPKKLAHAYALTVFALSGPATLRFGILRTQRPLATLRLLEAFVVVSAGLTVGAGTYFRISTRWERWPTSS